jgi:hypothetical protein
MATTRRWGDLSTAQQRTIAAVAVVEVVLTTRALLDLARRPADQVRGPKPAWALGCLVQPVGPVTYLMVGRRR